jgi:hypothetical protein
MLHPGWDLMPDLDVSAVAGLRDLRGVPQAGVHAARSHEADDRPHGRCYVDFGGSGPIVLVRLGSSHLAGCRSGSGSRPGRVLAIVPRATAALRRSPHSERRANLRLLGGSGGSGAGTGVR